ncbi:hypothetical protein ABIE26_003250 [Pedobacter africanus]|uniref:Uncharacterized protein n=1 Tax=Pedobacter africanus TaxID=151894 RepID=A0ACC6KZR5_9SPHI|nr:hypothetical protein [Pedobacter africanus]MDR6784604.1 hypothetical protein [Pedobacter africanus]
MKKIFFALSFYLVSCHVLVKAQDNQVLTAVDIVKKSIDATGGEAYLRSIKTLYSNIKTEMEGRQVNWIVKEMVPNKGSFMVKYEGRTVFQNWFDGKDGYETNRGAVQKADPKEFADKAYKQNIFNELDYINPQLWTLERLEDGTVGKADCYKVKGTLKNGLVEIFYFDKLSNLMLRSDKLEKANQNSFKTTLYLNYKKYGKLVYYSELKMGEEGNFKTLVLEELLVNEKVEEGDFSPKVTAPQN